jgi:hypothetical protein
MLMSMAAKEKTSSRWTAWLAPILFLLAAVAAAGPASALTRGALETRAWEKTSAPLDSCLDESLQLLNLHQQNGGAGYDDALGSPLAAESGEAAPKYGSTPAGRPLTKHYETETGPDRNIPGSVVDNTVNTTQGVPGKNGTTVYYDPVNDVTVVTGNGGSIVSAHRGPP